MSIIVYKTECHSFHIDTEWSVSYLSEEPQGPEEFLVVAFTYHVDADEKWEIGQYVCRDGKISKD